MIGIVDYRAGNLTSVARALEHLRQPCIMSNDFKSLEKADRIIFPGVGAAGAAMADLRRSGLEVHLKKWVREGKPVLGICLGMQVLFDRSEEDNTLCLGIVPGEVKRFPADLREKGRPLKIPHMGWNSVKCLKESRLLGKAGEEAHMYFVHSYYVKAKNRDAVSGSCLYGTEFDAAIECGSVFGFQFHPEKSGECGIELLKKFVRICKE